MSDALFSDQFLTTAPRPAPPLFASHPTPRLQPATIPGLLAVGTLGLIILATCLLAIGFCFVGV